MNGKRKKTIFEKRYAEWIPGDINRVNAIVKLAGKNHSILDLGCGTGYIGEKIIAKGNKVYGIDYSSGAVKRARKAGLIARQGDLIKGKLPYKTKMFDGVIMGEVIEHVIDTDAFLREASRVLKDNGYLIITTPNIASFGRRLMLLFGINPHIEYYYREDSAGHVRYFTKKTLFSLLADNGFKAEKFTSDEINFDPAGRIKTRIIAELIPTIGRTLILKARKLKKANKV